MKFASIRTVLIALLVAAFSTMALAQENGNAADSNAADAATDAQGRCNRPGVDCTFEKMMEILTARYGVTTLANPAPPTANYVFATEVDDTLYVSSAGSEILTGSGGFMKGELPGLTLAQAQEAAMLSCVRSLRFIKATIDDLDEVEKVLMVTGTVNVAPTYDDVTSGPAVGALGKTVDGCSDFLVQVFGRERGLHARSSGGKVALPFNMATEIELIVAIK